MFENSPEGDARCTSASTPPILVKTVRRALQRRCESSPPCESQYEKFDQKFDLPAVVLLPASPRLCELEEFDGPTLSALVEASASSSGRGLLLPIKSKTQAAEVPPQEESSDGASSDGGAVVLPPRGATTLAGAHILKHGLSPADSEIEDLPTALLVGGGDGAT